MSETAVASGPGRLRRAGRMTFSALGVPNYRRYFFGQTISLVGTWMQTTAQAWLVLTLTNSATDLGFVIALQTLPILLLGPYGGVIADRVDKRRLMVVLQSLMGIQALVLGLLSITHVIRLWEVCVLAVLLGLNNTFENPARQAFVLEMVGPTDLRNAVTLNSVTVNAARAVGPAVAGVLIATVGVGVCFLANAASFVAVVASLMTMDKSALDPSVPSQRAKGQMREGLSYVRHNRRLAVPLVMMAMVGMLTYEFQVSLPELAKHTFHGSSEAYGFMTAAMGIGAVIGGLWTAARGSTGTRPLVIAAMGFGAVTLLAALAPILPLELIALALVGWGSVSFLALGNSTLQLNSDPSMRGRVMALWAVAFLGSTPIGGPTIGWVIRVSNPRIGLVVGAVTCFVAAGVGALSRRRFVARRVVVPTDMETFDKATGGPVHAEVAARRADP
ncbi:MAG: MFS transporter [Acidimicrobiales bacterium]